MTEDFKLRYKDVGNKEPNEEYFFTRKRVHEIDKKRSTQTY